MRIRLGYSYCNKHVIIIVFPNHCWVFILLHHITHEYCLTSIQCLDFVSLLYNNFSMSKSSLCSQSSCIFAVTSYIYIESYIEHTFIQSMFSLTPTNSSSILHSVRWQLFQVFGVSLNLKNRHCHISLPGHAITFRTPKSSLILSLSGHSELFETI